MKEFGFAVHYLHLTFYAFKKSYYHILPITQSDIL